MPHVAVCAASYRRAGVEDDDDQVSGEWWVGTTDAAEYLGITPRTIYRLIDDGDIPAYRIGRVIRVRIADLDAYIEASRIEPGTLGYLYGDAS